LVTSEYPGRQLGLRSSDSRSRRLGDLRIVATVEGRTIVLLDVLQKKRQEIRSDVLSHLK
jgi:hypothetical protein